MFIIIIIIVVILVNAGYILMRLQVPTTATTDRKDVTIEVHTVSKAERTGIIIHVFVHDTDEH